MKKYLLLILFSFYSVHSFASDKLHGSVWKTIDDATNQPRALVKFSQDKNGVLSANIEKILVPSEANKCTMCEGTYKNKSLIGLTIVKNLKNVGQNKYSTTTSLSPKLFVLKNSNIKPSIKFKTMLASGFNARVSKLKISSKISRVSHFLYSIAIR